MHARALLTKPALWPVTLKSPWTVVIAVPLLVAVFDRPNTLAVVRFALDAFVGTLPFILLAVVLVAYLKASGAESLIARVFAGRESRMIFLAALFGGLAPFCSCEVIPIVAGLLAVGVPLSAVMAFWLSSPLIDPPTLLITAAALGWSFAIAKGVAAVALGLFGGYAVSLLHAAGLLSQPVKQTNAGCCGCSPAPRSGKPHWAFWHAPERTRVFATEFRNNALFLIKWLMLAYALESLLVTYLPAEWIVRSVGGEGIGAIVVAALVGMPAYLNSYVAPPLLAGLIQQGMTAGAALAFMVAGAVSSIPAMAAVWSLVRMPVFALYLLLGVLGAILSGLAFQTLQVLS